jgi:hypothetical protein
MQPRANQIFQNVIIYLIIAALNLWQARTQRGVPEVRPVLHLRAETTIQRHQDRRNGNPSSKGSARSALARLSSKPACMIF